MLSESNIKTVQMIYGAFGRGDVPAIVEALANDVDWGVYSRSSAGKSVPWHEHLVGKNSVPRFFAALAENADFTRFEPKAFVANDEYVYCTIAWEATLKKNSKKLGMTVIHRFTFKNGRITEWIGTEDTALSVEMLTTK
jgi:ketosteroid isomerase-like protein